MKQIYIITLVSILFCGCSKTAVNEMGYGEFTNGVYENEYLDFSIKLPKDWSILDAEANKAVMEAGSNMLSGDDKNLAAQLKASELQNVSMFTVSKYERGSPVESNPTIMGVAEKITHMPGIKSGKDYHFFTKQLLEQSQVEVNFPSEISREAIGRYNFDILDVEIPSGGITIKQKYYVAIEKGYALALILSYTNESEFETLNEILKTIGSNKTE
jgi:hypothetical protein